MKRMLTLAAVLGIAGCFPNTFRTGPVPGTDANQEIAIPVGETRTLDEQQFAVSFGRVLEDSRCPSGAQCVSAGNAHVALLLQERGESTRTVQLNTNVDPRVVKHEGYRVELVGLDPLPTAGQPAPENYVVRLRVTRG